MVSICWWYFQCSSGGHSFTVGVHRYTARPGTSFYFTLLKCIGFVLSYHLFFLFVCFLFLFPLPPPILGIRSLAGGRREYGRSGREPLFLNPFFHMLVFWSFPCILSWSRVENAAIPTQFVRHFSVFICSHNESGRIGFLTTRVTLALRVKKLWLYNKIRPLVRRELSFAGIPFHSPWKDSFCFIYLFI